MCKLGGQKLLSLNDIKVNMYSKHSLYLSPRDRGEGVGGAENRLVVHNRLGRHQGH